MILMTEFKTEFCLVWNWQLYVNTMLVTQFAWMAQGWHPPNTGEVGLRRFLEGSDGV